MLLILKNITHFPTCDARWVRFLIFMFKIFPIIPSFIKQIFTAFELLSVCSELVKYETKILHWLNPTKEELIQKESIYHHAVSDVIKVEVLSLICNVLQSCWIQIHVPGGRIKVW